MQNLGRISLVDSANPNCLMTFHMIAYLLYDQENYVTVYCMY